MGLFNFKRKKGAEEAPTALPMLERQGVSAVQELSSRPAPVLGVDAIYAFMQTDYEAKGYDDALTNPEESYKKDNVRLFQYDLKILIQRSFIYYDDKLKEIDFHIGTRTRAGLVDLVEELKIKRVVVLEHIEKLKILQQDAENNTGFSERISLSYQRGFMRGLAAITQTKIMDITL
jgi:hypothetical protein